MGSTVAVGVGVSVGGIVVAVAVGLGVAVGVGVAVAVRLGVAVGVGVAVSAAGIVVAVAVGVGVGSSPPHATASARKVTATIPRAARQKLRFGRRLDFIIILLQLNSMFRRLRVADKVPYAGEHVLDQKPWAEPRCRSTRSRFPKRQDDHVDSSSPSEKHGWRVLGGMMGPVQ